MSHLREGIHLRGYAQEDPLRAYTMEGFDLPDIINIELKCRLGDTKCSAPIVITDA